ASSDAATITSAASLWGHSPASSSRQSASRARYRTGLASAAWVMASARGTSSASSGSACSAMKWDNSSGIGGSGQIGDGEDEEPERPVRLLRQQRVGLA